MIKDKEKIELIINDGDTKEINLSYKRKVYTNEAYDTTIIEILPDIDKINNYLSLDENIKEISTNSEKNSIYALQYPDGNEASVSYGIIEKKEKKENEYEFKHLCSTKTGSSGAPILNLKTNKVIGIHCGQYRFEDFNSGIFLIEPIKEFQQDKNILKIIDKPIVLKIPKKKESSRNNNYNNFQKEEKGNKRENLSVSKEKEKKDILPPIFVLNQIKKDNKAKNFDKSPENILYKSNSSIKLPTPTYNNNFTSLHVKKSTIMKWKDKFTKNKE